MSQLPSNEQIEQDLRADIQNIDMLTLVEGMQMGKTEPLLLYDNEMKKTFDAQTDAPKKKFRGLAIYQRASENDPWIYSRHFIFDNTVENLEVEKMSIDQLSQMILQSFRKNIGEWGGVGQAYHFYGMNIAEESIQMISEKEVTFSCVMVVAGETNQNGDLADIAKVELHFQPHYILPPNASEWTLMSAGCHAPDTVGEVLYPALPYEKRSALKRVATHFKEILGPNDTIAAQLG